MKMKSGLIGQMLPNGLAEIRAISQWANGDGIVLAYSDHKKEWITWEFYRNELSTTSHGHYTTSFFEAVEDYSKRVTRMYDRINAEATLQQP